MCLGLCYPGEKKTLGCARHISAATERYVCLVGRSDLLRCGAGFDVEPKYLVHSLRGMRREGPERVLVHFLRIARRDFDQFVQCA